ncbi:serine acetyltransferase [Terrisporobacter sp.]|uniref:serine acetyltransferase n=1 Tax=Terrisporobacter sp. TaxID=1965305 RepID=UPI0028A08BC7|nr:serine acetyltransferase [Terrisporobacter sp.]
MSWWRKYEDKSSLLTRLILYRYSRKFGLEISTKAEIDKGLYLGHPYNITVAGGVKMGKNVNLHKGCTIGRENRGARVGCPIIGDCVYIGINATVVGNITIGNDVMIAPNSFVNFNVPDNSIVLEILHRFIIKKKQQKDI